jgi:fructan beta-fructosidase
MDSKEAKMIRTLLSFLVLTSLANAQDKATGLANSLIIADFEANDYKGWTTTGTAFGTAPAKGTLPGQMNVGGFLGKGLVNSFVGGDQSTGTLTSPPFKIEHKIINFLVGGGGYADETYLELLIDGKPVRKATGPNTEAGGSENLRWKAWKVDEFQGKTATIRIVDNRTGGWGHINVDHFVQSDDSLEPKPFTHQLVVANKYLYLPVQNGAPKQRLKVLSGGVIIREFEIELAKDRTDFQVFMNLADFDKQTIVIEGQDRPSKATIDQFVFAKDVPDKANLYNEKHRPQFHFTSRRGWLNDPNGLVFHNDTYHLFYQHNPYGREWGNMHWGHAISTDLVHWKEQDISVYPAKFGDWAFSGSAISHDGAIIVAFTSTGRGECFLKSTDEGKTWTEFDGNPLVKHVGRDPKILWHAPSKQWIMAVYDEGKDRQSIAFHGSADLKSWTYLSKIDGFFECPDMFELPVDGEPLKTRWVLFAADGQYMIGTFNGKEFEKESGKHKLWYGNFYASQTFSNTPDGRRIQIGWANDTKYPDMPFNQQMTVPVNLTLRTIDGEIRMFAAPVEELATLRGKPKTLNDIIMNDRGHLVPNLKSDLLEVDIVIEPGTALAAGLKYRGLPIRYDTKAETLTVGNFTAPLPREPGPIQLQILIDKASVEVFAKRGQVAFSVGFVPSETEKGLSVFTEGGAARFPSLKVYELDSIWKD